MYDHRSTYWYGSTGSSHFGENSLRIRTVRTIFIPHKWAASARLFCSDFVQFKMSFILLFIFFLASYFFFDFSCSSLFFFLNISHSTAFALSH